MKIITVNLPVKDIKTIKTLVGEKGLFPSRSELIRVAIRDFLIKELHVAKSFYPEEGKKDIVKHNEPEPGKVKIPIWKEGKKTWKTYQIIQK